MTNVYRTSVIISVKGTCDKGAASTFYFSTFFKNLLPFIHYFNHLHANSILKIEEKSLFDRRKKTSTAKVSHFDGPIPIFIKYIELLLVHDFKLV